MEQRSFNLILVPQDENLVETSSSSHVAVTSTSNHILDFVDEFGTMPTTTTSMPTMMVEDSNSQVTLNLPTNPQRGQLQEIPRGWIRKIVTTGKGSNEQKVFYYNTMGKKFSCKEEVEQYFGRLGQTVKAGLFNFEPPKFTEDEALRNGTMSTHV